MDKAQILVVGAGRMGTFYIKCLKKAGIQPYNIIVVDIQEEKLKEAKELFPEIKTELKIKDAFCKNRIIGAIVAVNTPAHHQVIVDLVLLGVKYIFSEKPLAINVEAVKYIEENKGDAKIFTAFLMNFSGAVIFVAELMKKANFRLTEASFRWGKDRTGDSRPTPGDLEDEFIHGFGIVKRLAGINQSIVAFSLKSGLSFLSYVDDKTQKKAHASDGSFPLRPNSSSAVIGKLYAGNGTTEILVSCYSSFLMLKQTREVSLVLADAETGTPALLVQMNFDTTEGDEVLIKKTGQKQQIERHLFKEDKVFLETKAFLDTAVLGNEPDERLTDFFVAKKSVFLTGEVIAQGKK